MKFFNLNKLASIPFGGDGQENWFIVGRRKLNEWMNNDQKHLSIISIAIAEEGYLTWYST